MDKLSPFIGAGIMVASAMTGFSQQKAESNGGNDG